MTLTTSMPSQMQSALTTMQKLIFLCQEDLPIPARGHWAKLRLEPSEKSQHYCWSFSLTYFVISGLIKSIEQHVNVPPITEPKTAHSTRLKSASLQRPILPGCMHTYFAKKQPSCYVLLILSCRWQSSLVCKVTCGGKSRKAPFSVGAEAASIPFSSSWSPSGARYGSDRQSCNHHLDTKLLH